MDNPGGGGEDLGRQQQRSTVEKHGKPLVSDEEIVVTVSSTGDFLIPGGDTPSHYPMSFSLFSPCGDVGLCPGGDEVGELNGGRGVVPSAVLVISAVTRSRECR